jgi:hypothetical protein
MLRRALSKHERLPYATHLVSIPKSLPLRQGSPERSRRALGERDFGMLNCGFLGSLKFDNKGFGIRRALCALMLNLFFDKNQIPNTVA